MPARQTETSRNNKQNDTKIVTKFRTQSRTQNTSSTMHALHEITPKAKFHTHVNNFACPHLYFIYNQYYITCCLVLLCIVLYTIYLAYKTLFENTTCLSLNSFEPKINSYNPICFTNHSNILFKSNN